MLTACPIRSKWDGQVNCRQTEEKNREAEESFDYGETSLVSQFISSSIAEKLLGDNRLNDFLCDPKVLISNDIE